MAPLLEVDRLRVEFPTRRGVLVAVDDISFSIEEGEVLGVVGESGAGKSVTGAAVIGLLEPPGRIARGNIRFEGRQINGLPHEEMRRIRGAKIGAIFQDPLTSLNPLYSIGQQLTETLATHMDLSPAQARARTLDLLNEVGIPAAERRVDSYPHEFSGGMRQRVVIALAICANPRLIIADEPTTALDVSIQAQIIALLRRLCHEPRTAIMLITHDMGIIAEMSDRVAVMYAGRIAEIGPLRDVVKSPKHPYTVGLMDSIPKVGEEKVQLSHIRGSMPRLQEIPPGCPFHPRCPEAFDRCQKERPDLMDTGNPKQIASCWKFAGGAHMPDALPTPSTSPPLLMVQGLSKYFALAVPWLRRIFGRQAPPILKAVDGVSFEIQRGQTFALVGESGCGKSTVARVIVGLYAPTSGEIRFQGKSLEEPSGHSSPEARTRMQMIFQDPYASLDPRWRVRDIIAEPMKAFHLAKNRSELRERVSGLLLQVGLSPSDGEKYPHEFSGGQRQRISIARALSSHPDFLVCDEPTSALDVSVQAQILNLMKELQTRLGLTYLFISHNLAVVHHISDHVGVMYLGRLCEVAPKRMLFSAPQHPYTRLLLDTIPDLDLSGRRRQPVTGEVPNPIDPPSGCAFHPRCPAAADRCRVETPNPQPSQDSLVACHAVEEGRL